MKRFFVFCALIVSLLSVSSCATRAVVTTRPEPPVAVVRPAAPHPDYIWIDGEWVWREGEYHYKQGYWVPARQGHAWIAGHWEKRKNGWYWEKGYWK